MPNEIDFGLQLVLITVRVEICHRELTTRVPILFNSSLFLPRRVLSVSNFRYLQSIVKFYDILRAVGHSLCLQKRTSVMIATHGWNLDESLNLRILG